MATLKVFDQFFNDLLLGKHHFGTDVFKVRLSATTPVKDTMDQAADVTAITGGTYADATVTLAITEPSTGTFQIGGTGSDVTFTATGSDFTGFRYAYLFNDTDAGDALVAVLDYGSTVNVTAGNSFTVDAGTNGWAQFVTPAWA